MREITTTTKVFKFKELSDEGKEKALENLRDINVNYSDWHEFTIEDFTTQLNLFGIEDVKVYFSGFYSQGDGAMFECNYSYKKGGLKAVKEFAEEKGILEILERIQEIQKNNFYGMSVSIIHRGHYYHENCTEFSIDHIEERAFSCYDDLEDCFKDLMRYLYRKLEKEYYYLISDAAIIETIEANDYEFTEDGELY